jgi:SAM-dependent methyltransferase
MRKWYEDDAFWDTWAPVMFSEERLGKAPEEVDNLVSLCRPKAGASVLDLCCGPGRHSLELARRGFSVTGVDRTKRYLEEARRKAKKEGLGVEFIQKDMRKFLRPKAFDMALNLFTSFGFFEDQKEDELVAKNVFRSLKNGGVFVVDIMGKEIIARIFQERDWHRVNGGIMLLVKGGRVEEFSFSLRPYSAAELVRLLTDCGFSRTEVYGSLAGTPYDHQAKRLVVVAHKAKQK